MCIWSKITWEVCGPVARRSKSLAGDQENPMESRGLGKYKESPLKSKGYGEHTYQESSLNKDQENTSEVLFTK